jgi:hypothetical protein
MSSLQLRMKEIEVRLSLLEREMSEIKASRMPSVPLNQSNLPSPEVLSWAAGSIEEIYHYNYRNFPQVLTAIHRYFTNPGYDSYMKALDESKNLQAVQDKKLSVSAKATGKGTIVKEGVVSDIYTWEVQLPIEVTYAGPTDAITQNLVANIEIVRVPNSDSPQGIAIHSITASVATAKPATPAESKTTTTTTTTTSAPAPAPGTTTAAPPTAK